ncbi:MAG: hypothetical protein ACI4JK_05260 [Oscillospiraceae bacterium]
MDYITEEMRTKAKTAALHILDEMQSDGMTEAEVALTAFWLDKIAQQAIQKSKTVNKFKNILSLEEI